MVGAVSAPMIQLTKSGTHNDTNNNFLADVGENIDYTFTVANNGNTTLTGVILSDPLITNLNCAPVTIPLASLAPAGSFICTGSYTLTQADINSGSVVNTANASGNYTNCQTNAAASAADQDSATIQLPVSRSIDIVKDGSFNAGIDNLANPSELITYTITVTNTGNQTLNNVTVSDPLINGTLSCLSSIATPVSLPTVLTPQDYITCTGTYPVTQSDINLGFVDNTASTAGTATGYPPVTDNDSHHQVLPVLGKLSIDKQGSYNDVNGDTYGDTGDKIDYTIVVTNIGNITLTNVSVSDPLIPGLVCNPASPIAVFNPGDSTICTGSYTLTLSDINAGSVMNTAMSSGQGALPVEDSANFQIPGLQPTPTPTATPTNTPTNTPTPTHTSTPTSTSTPTRTQTNNPTSTNTPTSTPTNTPTPTATSTNTPTVTPTATPVVVLCQNVNISSIQTKLDGIGSQLRGLVINSVKALEKKSRSRSDKELARSTRLSAEKEYIAAWKQIYTIPSVLVPCEGTLAQSNCSLTEFIAAKKSYDSSVTSLNTLLAKVQARLTKLYKGKLPASQKRVASLAVTYIKDSKVSLEQVPNATVNVGVACAGKLVLSVQ